MQHYVTLIEQTVVGRLIASGEAAQPLQYRVDTSIFTLIIFLALMYILYRYAWKPIAEGLDKRQDSIQSQIDAARQANQQAQANLKLYEEKLAGVTDQASAVLAEAKRDAEAVKQRILAEAQVEARRLRDRALADIETAKNQAVRELAESSVDSAVALAGNIVGRALQKQDYAKLITDSINQFTNGA